MIELYKSQIVKCQRPMMLGKRETNNSSVEKGTLKKVAKEKKI